MSHSWGCICAALVVLATAMPVSVQAEEGDNKLGIGLRVGGYGFREIDGDSSTQWTDCRMDGIGVFNTISFTPSWFVETSIDYYQAIGSVVEEEGMDRLSLHALATGGFRAFPSSIFSPTVQVGIGGEFTRVTWAGYEETLASFFPMGFVGAGGELSIGDHAVLGANIRMFMMAGLAPQEEHEHSDGVHLHTPSHAEPQAAGQLQFWFRYDL